MALTKADELLIHQLPETFDTILQSDRTWTEKIWCTLHDSRGEVELDLGFGRYQNRNVFDGFGGVSIGDTQWNVRASRELDAAFDSLSVGPLHYEIVEPLQAVRFRCDQNEYGVEYDVTLRGALPPHLEARNFMRDRLRTMQNIQRYHQVGQATGWVRVEGRYVEITPDGWWGQRDHSWGLRPGVGGPELGVQPPSGWGAQASGRPARRLLHWSPMQFRGWEIFHFWIGADLSCPDYFSGTLITEKGEEQLGEMRSELRYDERNRRLLGGDVCFTRTNGEVLRVNVRPLGAGYDLGGGLYMGYQGNYHGTYRGPLNVEGEKWADTRDPKGLGIGQLRDAVCEFRCGDDVGYGIFETIVTGEWPEYGLTLESNLS
ncbi:MAG: hypothetical protein IT304_10330 [Dehalococcoidia bacterium]|nr:hypothetical protein [Dehalococcoidia bacterium]